MQKNSQEVVLPTCSPFEDESRIKYLRAHPDVAKELERREGQLQKVILQAAKHGDLETLQKALPLLRKMREIHPSWRILRRTDRPLDFHDDRVSSRMICVYGGGVSGHWYSREPNRIR